jgi:selenide, water dikinase
MIPGGAYRNLEYMMPHVNWEGADEIKDDILIIMADPQTSGGLLFAVAPEKSDAFLKTLKAKNTLGQVIGRIIKGIDATITIR